MDGSADILFQQDSPYNSKNPQSNAIVERLQQTLNTIISISLIQNPPTSFEEVSSMVYRKCVSAQFAIRATRHSQHKFSPGEMAFGRHTRLPFSVQINWDDILRRKQGIVDKANIKENKGRRFHNYKVNDLILILNKNFHRGRLEPTTLPKGPWRITQVHIIGSVSILRRNYIERMNIRRICPSFQES